MTLTLRKIQFNVLHVEGQDGHPGVLEAKIQIIFQELVAFFFFNYLSILLALESRRLILCLFSGLFFSRCSQKAKIYQASYF